MYDNYNKQREKQGNSINGREKQNQKSIRHSVYHGQTHGLFIQMSFSLK